MEGHRKIETWAIARLQPHPAQATLFGEPPEHEVKELASDMKANGQITPVEVLPDGTLLAGHKRRAAALLLGWTELLVWVRDELVGNPVAAEQRLIQDNIYRRQMGPIELARCYQRLKQLAKTIPGTGLADCEKRELRDQIGRRLGVSGRTLDRYLRVLEHTPQEVQAAVAAGKLALTVAEKVAELPKDQREQVAAEIRAGKKPGDVVRQHVKKGSGRHKDVNAALESFVAYLGRGIADLHDRVEKLKCITRKERAVLDKGQDLLRQLQRRAEELPSSARSADDALATLKPARDGALEPSHDKVAGG